jgi:hypothetical protein
MLLLLQGTNAAHLAQCLGLDPSRYGGSSSSAGGSMAAALREEAMQVGGAEALGQLAADTCWLCSPGMRWQQQGSQQ